ncbi:Elongation factor 3 (EF-3) (Eukaryotic elongation factor 3) (eEF3) [Durusdinium trenchii]|uniref:Elongation factor 3 (EF-3) (Eukaryotic elongation factor 3) (EEF3) n=1 Tax=Durusdinium trenchii TaxID=1381693 RepID=A0ABP0HY63_9DINO
MPPPLRPKGEHREAPSDERPTLASVFAPPKRKVAPEAIKEDAVRRAVQQGCPTLDEDAIDYLANMAVSLVQDFNDAESLRQELEEGFLPMLEEYEISTEDAQSLCASVLQAAAPSDGPAAELGAVDEAEFLCYLPNLLLMYGGSPEPLLRGACLEIRRGHRYGVVGSNGSGKTTLMARIASKDISGLPEDLRVVLLRHEAILQGVRRSTKVRDYVQQRNVGEDAASEEDMENALQCMGFETEEQMGKAVLELSGGWQMRLALACAVARKANLLLLDEPTNHLDAEGVKWLVDFINKTCADDQGAAMIVSHDPDFLDLVCTDVVHFSPNSQKGKLAYYPGIFSAFKANQLNGDDAEAKRVLETEQESSLGLGPNDGNRMAFPIPERIGDTTAERKAAVVTLDKASFQYKGKPLLSFPDSFKMQNLTRTVSDN